MKIISAEKAKEFISQLEDILCTLDLDDKTWNQFDTLIDLYFGGNSNAARDDIIEKIAIVWRIEDA